jgi:hypothetical protein
MFRIMETKFSTMLDCACGRGKWGYLVRIWLACQLREAYIVGCDAWLPHLYFCKSHRIYDDEVRCDVRWLPFRGSSADMTVACEVIEHLPKDEGIRSIHEMERVTNLRLIVSTPNGPWRQNASADDCLEAHQSSWSTRDLQGLGFQVIGLGPPPFTRSRAIRILSSKRLASLVARVFVVVASSVSPSLPRLGTLLVAWKDRR